MHITADNDDPILACWHFGLGKMLGRFKCLFGASGCATKRHGGTEAREQECERGGSGMAGAHGCVPTQTLPLFAVAGTSANKKAGPFLTLPLFFDQ